MGGAWQILCKHRPQVLGAESSTCMQHLYDSFENAGMQVELVEAVVPLQLRLKSASLFRLS